MPNWDHICPECGESGSYLDFPNANTKLLSLQDGIRALKEAEKFFRGAGIVNETVKEVQRIIRRAEADEQIEAETAESQQLRCPDPECDHVADAEEFADLSYYGEA